MMTPAGTATTSPYQGSRVLADGKALTSAFHRHDWLDGGIAFFTMLGDAAAAMTDPIGAIAQCGLGWVMSHLAPLSTWLNKLAGSESAVKAFAQQWTAAGSTMRNAGSLLSSRLSDLDGLSGETVDAYRSFASDTAEHVAASGDWADAVSDGLTTASQLVAKMQSVVKSAISKVLATAIEAMAVVAASWGLGIGYAIARVVERVNYFVNKVGKPILQVLKSVKSLVSLVQQFHSLFDSTSNLVSSLLGKGSSTATLTAGSVQNASSATLFADTGTAKLLAGAGSLSAVAPVSTVAAVAGLGGAASLQADGPIASGSATLEGSGGSAAMGSATTSSAGGSTSVQGGGSTAANGAVPMSTAGAVAAVGANRMLAPGGVGGAPMTGGGTGSARRREREDRRVPVLTGAEEPTEADDEV